MSTAAIIASVFLVISIIGSTFRAPGADATKVPPSHVESLDLSGKTWWAHDFLFRDVSATKLLGYVLSVNPRLAEAEAGEMVDALLRYADQEDIDPVLVAALIARESSFNPRAISPSGAQGLGQLLPQTASDLGVFDPYDPEENIRGTTRYIKKMVLRWEADANAIPLALASYKEGYGAVRQSGGNFSEETKRYIQDILRSVTSVRAS